MMDVSGSMGDEQKEIVRIESFWLDTWLRTNTRASRRATSSTTPRRKEVDRDTFFHTRESGGTMISSAYKLCRDIIEGRVPGAASGTSTRSTSQTATTGRPTTPGSACSC
jgi:uncharacterized sporulation protein YeaH/YhbH (DUF444 family)